MGELKSALDISLQKAGKIEEESGEKLIHLTNSQKEKIAETRKLYDAKIAEREIMLQNKIEKVKIHNPDGGSAQMEELKNKLNEDKAALLKERDKKIDKIREGKS